MKKVKKILAIALGVILMTASLQGMAFAAPAETGESAAAFSAGVGKTVAVSAAEMEAEGADTVSGEEAAAGGELISESFAGESDVEDASQEADAQEDAKVTPEQEEDLPEEEAEENMPEETEEVMQEDENVEASEAEKSAPDESEEAEQKEEISDIAETEANAPEEIEEAAQEEVAEASEAEENTPEESTESVQEEKIPETEAFETTDPEITGSEAAEQDRESTETVVPEKEVSGEASQEEPVQEQTDEAIITEPAEEETVSQDALMAASSVNTPKIALTFVPKYGMVLPMMGYIYKENGGSVKASDYRIALYLQVSEGGSYWVKPTYAHPYVDLFDDGFFSGEFVTGGEDRYAKALHLLLIPSSYTPEQGGTASFNAAKEVALDYLMVTRTEEGDFSLSIPERFHAPDPVSSTVLPVSSSKIAVNVGFYTDGSSPGSTLSKTLIKQQLEMVKGFSNVVRFYSSGGEVQKAYSIAHSMGLSVIGTAWLSKNESDNKAELDALIENCNAGTVQVACVGSETLLRGDLTAEKLIEYIKYVRKGVTDKSIPITTADTLVKLVENRPVMKACDLIMPNTYPYWEGRSISDAAEVFEQSIAYLQGACISRQIIVSETGWPTEGQTKYEAVAGETESAQYFEIIRNWSRSTGTQVLWFDATDEPWKSRDEGIAGAHWGLMTTDFVLKPAYFDTTFFTAIAKKTVDFTKAKVTGISDKTYTGKAIKQKPVVKLGTRTLEVNKDYKLSYKNNVNAGTATITITAIGKDGLGRSYTGSISSTFKITKAAQKITAKASKSPLAVGKTCAISVTGAEGTVSWQSSDTSVATVGASTGKVKAKKVGKVTITVKSAATKNYKAGLKKVSIKVVPAATASLKASNLTTGIKLTWEKVKGATGYRVYRDGSLIKKLTGVSTVTFTDKKSNTNGKKYTYKVVAVADTGLSTLSRSRVLYRLTKPAISTAANCAAGKIKVVWGKNAKGTGYQLQYSLKSDFSDSKTTVTLKGADRVSKVISSLKKGKTYYVRVRTHKTVSGKNYYSAWSPKKSVKITK